MKTQTILNYLKIQALNTIQWIGQFCFFSYVCQEGFTDNNPQSGISPPLVKVKTNLSAMLLRKCSMMNVNPPKDNSWFYPMTMKSKLLLIWYFPEKCNYLGESFMALSKCMLAPLPACSSSKVSNQSITTPMKST